MIGSLLARSVFEARTALRFRSGRAPPRLPIGALFIIPLFSTIPSVFCTDNFNFADVHQLLIWFVMSVFLSAVPFDENKEIICVGDEVVSYRTFFLYTVIMEQFGIVELAQKQRRPVL